MPRFLPRLAGFVAAAMLFAPACGSDDTPPTSLSGTIRIESGVEPEVRALASGNEITVTLEDVGASGAGSAEIATTSFVTGEFPATYELNWSRALDADRIYVLTAVVRAPNGDPLFASLDGDPVEPGETSRDLVLATEPPPVSIADFPLLEVTAVTETTDGVQAELSDDAGGRYVVTVSTDDTGGETPLVVGDRVRIDGNYAESFPVQILDVRAIVIDTSE